MTDRVVDAIVKKVYGDDDEDSLAGRLRAIIILAGDNLEKELEPYLKMYREHQQARRPDQQWYSFNGPHSDISYALDLLACTDDELTFEGVDSENDWHSFTMPISFLEEHEEHAEETRRLLAEQARVRYEAEQERQRLERERSRERRHQQYLSLKKEFEDE